MGHQYWVGPKTLWDAFDAPDKSISDLKENRKSSRYLGIEVDDALVMSEQVDL
jgi:hypothetical protein